MHKGRISGDMRSQKKRVFKILGKLYTKNLTMNQKYAIAFVADKLKI